MSTYRFRTLLALLLAASVAAGVLVTVIEARPAEAAFPGTNGKIAFASARTTGTGVDNPEGDWEIFTMNPDGTGLSQLTFNTSVNREPAWSSDGTEIAFVSNFEIYTMDADGSNQANRTNNPAASDLDPDWQPTSG